MNQAKMLPLLFNTKTLYSLVQRRRILLMSFETKETMLWFEWSSGFVV